MDNIEVKTKEVMAAKRKISYEEKKENSWYECPDCQCLGILSIKLNISHIYI